MKSGRNWVPLTLVAVVVAIGLAGCGETQTIVRTVTATQAASASASPASRQPASAPASAAPAESSTPHPASVGDQISLTGADGLLMGVTVNAVMDPLDVGPYDQADSGQRYVGIQITLKNLGSVAYSDSPSNGATLLSSSGEQATPQIVSEGPCGNEFSAKANIAAGESQEGCIAFEMPTNESPGEFQFTLNSGFANQTGEWRLAGTHAGPSSNPAQSDPAATSTPAASGDSTSDGSSTSGSDPASALQTHLEDLGSGQYQAAFAIMSSSYQARNPSWIQNRSAANPGINVISVGQPQSVNGGARVPVDFYARDRNPTAGSDTQCREFRGSAAMVQQDNAWRYDPSGNSLTATVVPSGNPNCP